MKTILLGPFRLKIKSCLLDRIRSSNTSIGLNLALKKLIRNFNWLKKRPKSSKKKLNDIRRNEGELKDKKEELEESMLRLDQLKAELEESKMRLDSLNNQSQEDFNEKHGGDHGSYQSSSTISTNDSVRNDVMNGNSGNFDRMMDPFQSINASDLPMKINLSTVSPML
mmetsp:Transcript_18833/g.23093  ORF Transcript_18833/g.23093 Transcript_18833/m.23093 type:complete len:168 (+) Transcript_18833:740-1243(+)